MRDLVAYHDKHNAANGEDNNDGENNNAYGQDNEVSWHPAPTSERTCLPLRPACRWPGRSLVVLRGIHEPPIP